MTAKQEQAALIAEYVKIDGWIPENCPEINRLSYEIVKDYETKKGGAVWVGRINLYGEDRKQEYPRVLWPSQSKHPVWGAAFVVPNFDEQLQKMIRDRDKVPYTGTAEDYPRVDEIFNRVYALGGTSLHWT